MWICIRLPVLGHVMAARILSKRLTAGILRGLDALIPVLSIKDMDHILKVGNLCPTGMYEKRLVMSGRFVYNGQW
jgi:hypothetical protein